MRDSIKKFGLKYCDLPTMLSNVSTMLRLLALNIDGRNKEPIPIIIVIAMATCSVLYIYVYVISCWWFILWYAVKINDLTAAFVAFSLNTTSQVVVIKLYYMMLNEGKLKVLTNKYLSLDARVNKGSRFSNNMLKNLRNIKRRGLVFWWVLMVDAVLYVMRPLFIPGRHLSLDSYVIFGLQPMFESPNFEIASIVMSIDVLFICFLVANITCFLILIIGYIESQMLSLSEEMLNLWDDAEFYCEKIISTGGTLGIGYHNRKRSKTRIINAYIKDHLIDIVGKHSMNVSYLREIEDLMRGPNALGFLFLIMGLIAELLGGLDNTWLQLPFTMLQISVDCYLGQKVMDSNIKFERAVYDCKWELFNTSNRRIVLVMLQNSQKTMTLSAGGMATLSFSSLMSIIRTTYSAYTTLRSMV